MLEPQLSDRDILNHVDDTSFQRGRAYASEGRIFSPRRQGSTLKALCRGSIPEPYRLSATIGDGGQITAECSCPVGHGGHCKHVAALLLTWRADPERFVEVEDLSTALEGKSKEELVRLLLTVAAINPAIEQMLEITASGGEVTSPDARFYRDQVAATLGYGEENWHSRSGYGLGGRLTGLGAEGAVLAERGDWAGAAEVYRGVLEGIMEGEDLLYDEEGSLASVAGECIVGLGEALAHLEGPAERDPILNTLFEAFYTDIVEFGGIGIADAVPDILLEETTPEERGEIIARIHDSIPSAGGWSYEAFARLLFEFETEQLEGEAYLVRARELDLADRLVDRLLELGEAEEAVQTAANEPPADLGMLIPIFERHNQANLIEPLVAGRVAENAFGQFPIVRLSLARWLKSRYLARGDFAAALPLSLDDFKSHPNIAGYREVRDLAIQAADWNALRQDLLAWLAGRAPDLKTQIHLDEGEFDEAIADVRRSNLRSRYALYANDIRLQVVDAIATERPEAALEIYLGLADQLIENRGREKYAMAATLLGRARDLYDGLGRYDDWEAHIGRLRSENTRLRALREELDQAGL